MKGQEVLTITSTRDPDGAPVCELAWKGARWYAPVAEVRVTAIDLVTCAAYAELMMHLMVTLHLDAGTMSAMMSDLLSRLRSEEFGTPATVSLMPGGSPKRRQALVLIKRARDGKWEGEIGAAEAREMALRWLEAAEATESDQLVSEALRAAVTPPAGQEIIFGYLRELRKSAAAS